MILAMAFVACIYVILISAGSINTRQQNIRDGYEKAQWHDKISIHYLINKLKNN